MWQYVSRLPLELDSFGQYHLKVVITNGSEQRCIDLVFNEEIDEERILAEISKAISNINAPLSPRLLTPVEEENVALKSQLFESQLFVSMLNQIMDGN